MKKRSETVIGASDPIMNIASKAAESVFKFGADVASSIDPLEAAVTVAGKAGVGLSLSRFSASQCAGIVGVIVSSICPQVKSVIFLFMLHNVNLGFCSPVNEENKRGYRLSEKIS